MCNLFKIFEYKELIQEGRKNPKKLADSGIVNTLYTLSFIPLLVSVSILGILFLFGFTNVITTPSTIAKIFFIIILFAVLVFIFILRSIAKLAKRITKNIDTTIRDSIQESTVDDDSKIYDAEFTTKK